MNSITTVALLLISVAHVIDAMFTCTVRGRFKDETDPECKRYFLCSQKKNGKWVAAPYACPDNTNFNPDTEYCTTDMLCGNATTAVTTTELSTTPVPTTEPPSTPIPSNTNYECTTEGRFADTMECDCGWFYECKLIQSQWQNLRLYCPPHTKFDPIKSVCNPDYRCFREFVCTEAGIFAEQSDNTSYISCEQMVDGSFLQRQHVCLNETIFNDTLKRCVVSESTTTTTDATTTETTTTSLIISETSEPNTSTKFNCTQFGRFADPDDQICKWYYLCIDEQAFHYNCPDDLYFDPKSQECVSDYKCPFSSTTEKWPSTFTCKKRGYFENYRDRTSFHFCDVLADGKIYGYELMCPIDYKFDATTNLCSQQLEMT